MAFANDRDANESDIRNDIHYRQRISKAQRDLRNRLPKRMLKPKELWTYDKSKWQIMKIEIRQRYRKFDTATKGMGLFLVLVMGILVLSSIVPFITDSISTSLNKSKYENALKSACLDNTFYSWNFKACEDINIRPIEDSANEK